MSNKHFSQKMTVFHDRIAPEEGMLAGYGAIINVFNLATPLPAQLSLISNKKRQYSNDEWQVFTPRHKPEETLYKHLIFAMKYEGINLLALKKLFDVITVKEITEIVNIEPLSLYSRKIWFLYEWLMRKNLSIPNLKSGNFIPLLNEKKQYAIKGYRSSRQRIINNLPGTNDFCPLITRTTKLERCLQKNLVAQQQKFLTTFHRDLLQRAAAFLMLKDSKASFTIEGESATNKRAQRWGKAIGQAGNKNLTMKEFVKLQQLVIEDTRFIKTGFRKEGGFVGEHDRLSGEPIPEHISARWQDIDKLIKGLIDTNELLEKSNYDAVLHAAIIAFGFVFIHPFIDGNGRIHRYLIHHILAIRKFVQQGIIFPVSAAILDKIDDYRKALEAYSKPLLDFIEWKTTDKNNVEVVNETMDYYRYFDATKQAEFLFDCVEYTMNHTIPEEIDYLQKFDEMKHFVDNEFDMPDSTVDLLIRFLTQNSGKLSMRAKSKEFKELSDDEIEIIENKYQKIFLY